MKEKVFIAWEPYCTRSRNIAKHFSAENIFVYPFNSDGSMIKTSARYIVSSVLTMIKLIRFRPKIIFTLNQPPFLIMTVFLFSKMGRSDYVLDSHSAAFNDPKWSWFQNGYKKIASRALLNINTNIYHKDIIESWGGRSFVIGDVPIEFSGNYPKTQVEEKSIAVVVSFMFDEPIQEIWEAARQVPDVTFYVTGNYLKAKKALLRNVPANVQLTGYLERNNYLSLLLSVKGIMVLTTRNFTMQMGGYESLSLEQPLITSDWPILRESFGDGAVYVNATPDAIANGVIKFFDDYTLYKKAIKKQRLIRKNYFEHTKSKIKNVLNGHRDEMG